MKSQLTSVSRPRAPAVRFQGDGAASTNMLSIGSLSDFFDTPGRSDDVRCSRWTGNGWQRGKTALLTHSRLQPEGSPLIGSGNI
jgi:hypothetical protein